MRARIWVCSLFLLGSLLSPATPAAAETCAGQTCGLPTCWAPNVHVRPAMARVVFVSCRDALGATVVTPPRHGSVSEVSASWDGIRFKVLADDDAPREDETVLRVDGYEGTVDVRVSIEVIPTSENSRPVCWGDRIAQRSDGSEPVELYTYPRCSDPDHDEFVVYGGGPGVHHYSPKSVPAGTGTSDYWPYRTATSAGTETAYIWAIDVLDARSNDAPIEVTVGPGVDRLPTCAPNGNQWVAGYVGVVMARPGAVRRFSIYCEDSDGDPLNAALTEPPQRGQMALFDPSRLMEGYWGTERWIDTTYVPVDASLERDEFAVTATGSHGDGPRAPMAIVPVPLPENGGMGCGGNPVTTSAGTPTSLVATCDDSHGDPLTVTVAGAPLHGVAGPPAVVPARYGQSTVVVPYVPAPGFTGYDCVKLAVTDGHGDRVVATIDIFVREADELPEVELPPLPVPDLIPSPLPVPPSVGSGLPPGGAPNLRSVAQAALGTPTVRRLRADSGAEIWASRRLSKAPLLQRRRAPSLFVLCRARCTVRSSAWLLTGARGRQRGTRRRVVFVSAAGQAQVLWLSIDRRERRLLRRARRPGALFKLNLRAAGISTASLERRIRIAR